VATRSIGAENGRTRLADKRRIYARFQASLDTFLIASARLRTTKDGYRPGRESDLVELASALGEMVSSLRELQLIAPQPLGRIAGIAQRTVIDIANGNQADPDDASKSNHTRQQLHRAMRADLGEPVAEQPDIAQSGDPSSGGG
jgi:hypothetical protein